MLAVTILGNNSAIPAFDRHPTSQVVTLNEHLFLVDCGEGTQMQLARYRIKRSRIHKIFISHLHGDHYFGLMGIITSMGLLGREQDLHLYAPAPLKEIINLQLKAANTSLPYTLYFHSLKEGLLDRADRFEISCFKVIHRVDCWGFIFRELKPPRKIDGDKIRKYNIPTNFYEQLRLGHDYLSPDGSIISNSLVTEPSPKGKSYAYAADTVFDESIARKVKGVDTLYHETTYLKEMTDRAFMRYHSTTAQAATIANMAEVQHLLIGHFSSKYEKLDQFLTEAREVFENTDLAIEGVTYRV
jgi:ribonuclease Z